MLSDGIIAGRATFSPQKSFRTPHPKAFDDHLGDAKRHGEGQLCMDGVLLAAHGDWRHGMLTNHMLHGLLFCTWTDQFSARYLNYSIS